MELACGLGEGGGRREHLEQGKVCEKHSNVAYKMVEISEIYLYK